VVSLVESSALGSTLAYLPLLCVTALIPLLFLLLEGCCQIAHVLEDVGSGIMLSFICCSLTSIEDKKTARTRMRNRQLLALSWSAQWE
jgi:hypothetical protein